MVALCCMYTGYIVSKSIKNNAIITFYPINFIELYTPPIPRNRFLDKNSILKQNTGNFNYKHHGDSLFTTTHLI